MTDGDQNTGPPGETRSLDPRLLAPEPPSPPSWSSRFATPLSRLDVLVLLVLVAATALTYFVRLGQPDDLIPLDERHYVPDARDVLAFGTESDTRVSEESGAFVVHPPVGKWFIAAGIKLLGDDPTGWRFFGAFVGTISVVLVYLLARRLWASPWFAALAGLLLATEGIWFVQSRVAMLDIYVAFFVLAGAWLLLEDRDRTGIEHSGPRWWRLAAGASFGFALATKWSAIPFWLVAVAVAGAFEGLRLRRRRRVANPDLEPRPARQAVRATGAVAGALVLLPATLYLSTFTPWFVDEHRYDPPRCVPTEESPRNLASRWLCYQKEVVDFHRNLRKYEVAEEERAVEQPDGVTETETVTVTKPAHPYFSQGYSWPWIGRPVAHAYEATGEGDDERRSEVLGLPNPVTWIPAFIVGLPMLAWWTVGVPARRALRRARQRRRGEEPEPGEPWDPVAPVLLAFLVAGYGPILLADVVTRPVFMFYATPMVPFLVLGLVHVLVRATRGGQRAPRALIGYAVLAALSFAFFYPLLAAWPLPTDGILGWSSRIVYGSEPWRVFGWDLPFPPVDCLAENTIKTFCWI